MQPLHDSDFKPLVIAFDVDETGSTNYESEYWGFKTTYHSTLYPSAKQMLCNDPKGHFNVESNLWMHAIARKQFKTVFDRIYAIQTTHGEKCPIAVKVITRGAYTETEILKAWDQFYGDVDQRFTKNLIPIEFFNRYSFKKDGKIIGEISGDGSVYKKEELMEEYFSAWQRKLPGLEKSRVCLIDDNYNTIVKVREAGFSAIHFPTCPETSPLGVSFLEGGPKAIAALHEFIDTAVGEQYFAETEQTDTESETFSHSEEDRSDEATSTGALTISGCIVS